MFFVRSRYNWEIVTNFYSKFVLKFSSFIYFHSVYWLVFYSYLVTLTIGWVYMSVLYEKDSIAHKKKYYQLQHSQHWYFYILHVTLTYFLSATNGIVKSCFLLIFWLVKSLINPMYYWFTYTHIHTFTLNHPFFFYNHPVS